LVAPPVPGSVPDSRPDRAVDRDASAYIMFTSGSSGRAKGVTLRHRNVMAFVQWIRRFFSAEERARVVVAASAAFDASIFEIWAAFADGGTGVVLDSALDVVDLSTTVEPTLMMGSPSFFMGLLNAGRTLPSTLRTVCLAGEVVTDLLVAKVWEQPGVQRVVNAYGPTETTVLATTADLVDRQGARPPIGRPLDNVTTLVLDDRLQLVPSGVLGELFIGGAGVSAGYTGRDDLTTERFIEHPFAGRVYRTGDMVRWRADGQLDFVGRKDGQVKLRGFRVELTEIEVALLRMDGVQEAAAWAVDEGHGGALFAAVVCATASERELRDALAERLPGYMVPSRVLVVDRLPKTSSGKADRRALARRWTNTRSATCGGRVQPRSAIETRIFEIWRDLLPAESEFGVTDSFFDVGGHSLTAVEMLAQLESLTGRRLSPGYLINNHATIEQLASLLSDPMTENRSLASDLPPPFLELRRAPGVPAMFMMANDLNILALRSLLPLLFAPGSVYAVAIRRADGTRVTDSIHDFGDRLAVSLVDDAELQTCHLIGHSAGGLLAYELAGRLAERGAPVSSLILLDTACPELVRRMSLWTRRLERLAEGGLTYARSVGRDHLRAARRRSGQLAGGGGFEFYEARSPYRHRVRPHAVPLVVCWTDLTADHFGTTSLGWDLVHLGPLDTRHVSGGHLTMFGEPHVDVLGHVLGNYIA
jgi:amino acid adenylation domain-containing protein